MRREKKRVRPIKERRGRGEGEGKGNERYYLNLTNNIRCVDEWKGDGREGIKEGRLSWEKKKNIYFDKSEEEKHIPKIRKLWFKVNKNNEKKIQIDK